MKRQLLGMALALAVAGGALAAEMAGMARLDDVDFDARTVTIADQVFEVTDASVLADGTNEPISLLELEYELGESVFYKGIDRRQGGAVLEALQIAPEDASIE